MASKVVVMKGGHFEAQASAEKLSAELAALVAQLREITGVRTDAKTGGEFAEKTFVVEPGVKSTVLNDLKFLGSVYMADKKLSNTGRDPKADATVLERIYVEHLRANPKQNRSLAMMSIALKYNEGKEEKDQIDPGYVARNAKNKGWNNLLNVPEPTPEPATA